MLSRVEVTCKVGERLCEQLGIEERTDRRKALRLLPFLGATGLLRLLAFCARFASHVRSQEFESPHLHHSETRVPYGRCGFSSLPARRRRCRLDPQFDPQSRRRRDRASRPLHAVRSEARGRTPQGSCGCVQMTRSSVLFVSCRLNVGPETASAVAGSPAPCRFSRREETGRQIVQPYEKLGEERIARAQEIAERLLTGPPG
jgi:hypothetical protein